MGIVVERSYRLAASKLAEGEWSIDAERGVIYGSTGKALTSRNADGYGQIQFRDPRAPSRYLTVRRHRVIWEYVLHGPLSPDLEVNHRNGVKGDDRIENLESATPAENTAHAISTGLAPYQGSGAHAPSAVLTRAQVDEIRMRAERGERQRAIATEFGISQSQVSKIKSGRQWAADLPARAGSHAV